MAKQDDEGTEDTRGKGTEGAEDDEDDDPVTEDEGRKLLADPDDDTPDGTEQLGTAGRNAIERMKQQRREAREARDAERKRAEELAARLKQFEDKDKSELERATGELNTYKTRAEQAEARLMRRELAEELAPDHATPRQIAQVAKRMQGDDEDALKADAQELFELLVPAAGSGSNGAGKPPSRRTAGGEGGAPRGGADPTDEVGETDPYKLAALVQRRR